MRNEINDTQEPIRIYVADLAAYNAGHLHGVWIDATQDLDAIHAEARKMFEGSPVEHDFETAIHDYEGFGNYRLGEYIGIEGAHEVALFIEEHGNAALAALEYSSDLEEAQNLIEDNYHGCYDSEEEYAEQLFSDCYDIPDHLVNYIDYEKVARDMFCDGYFSVEGEGGLHIFSY